MNYFTQENGLSGCDEVKEFEIGRESSSLGGSVSSEGPHRRKPGGREKKGNLG